MGGGRALAMSEYPVSVSNNFNQSYAFDVSFSWVHFLPENSREGYRF